MTSKSAARRASHERPARRLLALGFASVLCLGAALAASPDRTRRTDDVTRVVGPAACAECHVEEFEVWQASHHQMGSKMLTRNPEAQKIAKALGIRRVKNEARCTTCHFTMMGEPDAPKAIAGVSCESCHGAARDWINLHDDFGANGAGAATETSAHRAERTARCSETGMVRPDQTHLLAGQCFACHTIDDEELIAAGHPTGVGFELVAWSQGEIRHNFVRGTAGSNARASRERLRVMFVIGQLLELEHAARALSSATGPGAYADSMIERAENAILELERILELASVPEVRVVLAGVARWTKAPGASADDLIGRIADCATKFEARNPGPGLSKLDGLLPAPSAFVGTPTR